MDQALTFEIQKNRVAVRNDRHPVSFPERFWKSIVFLICGVCSVFPPAEVLRGSDWPNVRGPFLDGTSGETGIVDDWSEQGPPILWTRELGQGYSSFAVWGDRIATQYQSLAGQSVICLDAETGESVWEYRYDWPYDPAGVYPGPRATPTWQKGYLYFASPAGLIGCLRATDGSLVWSTDLATTFGGTVITGFGYACSPTVTDGMVLLPVGAPGASLVALDAATGDVRWKAGNEPASYTPAVPIEFRHRKLVLGYLENAVVCHDRMSGELLWSHRLSTGYDEHSAWPIYREPYVWISSPFRAGSELLELTDDPQQPVRSIGRQRPMSNDIFSSVCVEGAVYGFDVQDPQAKTHRSTRGIFRCVDFLTGETLWSVGDGRPLRDNSVPVTAGSRQIGHSTVIAADGKLILFNDLGELILAKVSRTEFVSLARTSVLSGEICWTQPALSGGRLFVRNHSRAACVYLNDPSKLAGKSGARILTTADIPQRTYFDWASLILGVEPEYAFDLPSVGWLNLWFQTCLAILLSAVAVTLLLSRVGPIRRLSYETKESLFWFIVLVFGVAGTTILSPVLNDFVFTWPVAVFAAWQPMIDRMVFHRRELSPSGRWTSRLPGVWFVGVCVVYFLACRRLSLVFEWVFLIGYVAAAPLSISGHLLFRGKRWYGWWKTASCLAAFSVSYWSSAAFLYLRVRTSG